MVSERNTRDKPAEDLTEAAAFVRTLILECDFLYRKCCAELPNRAHSLLGSSPWRTNRELRCARRSDDADASWRLPLALRRQVRSHAAALGCHLNHCHLRPLNAYLGRQHQIASIGVTRITINIPN